MRTIYCVGFENDSSGGVNWWIHQVDAVEDYGTKLVEFPDDEINLFTVEVANRATKDQITREADAALWARDYTVLRWRKGKNHSAAPHDTPPTD